MQQTIPAAPATRADFIDYRRRWPGEAAVVDGFLALLDEGEAGGDGVGAPGPWRREREAGHFTASAWLVDRGGRRVLLTHHRKLGLWLQLGGHVDGDRDLARAALREAGEESGLEGLRVQAGVFDMDCHAIPAHGGVPAHLHYDVRYVVVAADDEDFVVSDESHALAWRDIGALADDDGADASLRRMARKWLARPGH